LEEFSFTARNDPFWRPAFKTLFFWGPEEAVYLSSPFPWAELWGMSLVENVVPIDRYGGRASTSGLRFYIGELK
jgi:hypothetical protein